MSDQRLGAGFRFSKVMAWAPAVILVLAFLVLFRGDLALGLILAVAAIIFWFVVRRRKSQAS